MMEATYYTDPRLELVALIPPGTRRLLDIGCGEGHMALAAKVYGVSEVFGVELVPSVAAEAEKRLDGAMCADIEATELPAAWGQFDCIVCADVLEHLKDPWTVLRRLRDRLTDNGALIASIPNIGHLSVIVKILLDRFEYADSGILDRTHLRFFTKHTIRQLFASTGYRIQSIQPHRVKTWKFRLAWIASLGLLYRYSAFQYFVVAVKERE